MNYVGWVVLKCGVPGAGTLPEEDGYAVLDVPPGGVVATEQRCRVGGSRVVTFWKSADGPRSAPDARSNFVTAGRDYDDRLGNVTYFFFYGSDAAYAECGRERDAAGLPRAGRCAMSR
ncbi:MAG: hypothetical protein QM704_08655 [Anaeromyxobacteraceae bacterium]